jgi:hypothetical protein
MGGKAAILARFMGRPDHQPSRAAHVDISMKLAIVMSAAALAAPLLAPAEILSVGPVEARPFIGRTMLVCNDRYGDALHRRALYDADKHDADREADRLARAKEQLTLRFTGIQTTNVKEVEEYNRQLAELNRQVGDYNRRVAELNGAASLLTADAASMRAYCNGLYVAVR